MQDEGMGSWPARRARMAPQDVALVQDGDAVTYGDLERLCVRAAHGLRERGAGVGDRVAYLGLNSIEFVITMLATAKLGAVFVPLNTRLAPPEIAFVLGDCTPLLLCHTADFDEIVTSAAVRATQVPTLLVEAAPGRGPAALLAADERPVDVAVGHDDLFMIQYTSGTTGRPKGVQLTHGNVCWNALNLLVDVDVRADEVALVTAPLFHTAALNQVLFPVLLKGGTSLIEARFSPERALELIGERGVTLLFGVTAMYLALTNAPGWAGADLRSLRSALSGGAPIPQRLLETFADRGVPIIQGYGLTEASPGVTMLRAPQALRKLGTAGTSCFFTDVRVVTVEGQDVPPGEPGEILVRGPNVTPGYWQNPQATAGAFVDGDWLRTGDLATTDDDGFVRIVDRVKDMIISGGENVYPAEVESAIHTHPAVAEVAVIGVPDETWGEVGHAVVVLQPGRDVTAADLLAHLDGRLARYKIPKHVQFCDELPHNASGKLAKTQIRKMVNTRP